MIMKRISILIICLTANIVFAQQISIHSPTVANLGLYGEIPVSYYTGTPNISIPLYEIKGKHVTVPVALSYHPAGIRPEIHPGIVGLGWSLRAGGVISRTVRGNSPDESENNGYVGTVEGYLKYANGWIAQNDWKENAKNALDNNCFACRNTVHNMAPYSDFEPDEFYFSFLNITGKFYFDHTGQIQVQCDNPVRVIFNNEFVHPTDDGIRLSYSSIPHRALKSFTIIDEQGTQYYFGGVTAIEFSDPISYGINNSGYGIPSTGRLLHATSWFLTQIKTADNADIINFEYERGPFVSQLYRSFNYYNYYGFGVSGWSYNNLTIDGTLISPVYLRRINRVNGEDISFAYTVSNDIKYTQDNYNALFSYPDDYDNYQLLDMINAIPRLQSVASDRFDRIQWLKLDTVSIKNTDDELIRRIKFNYNNNSSERLFLESLNVYGSDDGAFTMPMKYTFTYKNRNRLPAQYLTHTTDHWGFNNGKIYTSNSFNSQYKTPDANYTDSGILSEIRYPTGGTAQFVYELHDYGKVVNTKNRIMITNQSGTASGLRIKKIITDNSTGGVITREYFYKETPFASVSSGVLNMLPQYTYSISGMDCDNNSFNMSVVRSIPIIPLTKDNEGLYIGYTYVCEQVSDVDGGYTQYHYTNHDNGHSDILLANGKWHRDIFPSDPHCSRYFERGRLKKETFYNAEKQPVTVHETVWSRYGSQGENNPRAFLFEGIKIGHDYCSSAAYLHYCYKFLPFQKTDTVYNPNGLPPTITAMNYSYNSYNLLKEETKNINGEEYMKRYKYTGDYDVTSPLNNSDHLIINQMQALNMTGCLAEEQLLIKKGGAWKLLNGELTRYGSFSGLFKPWKKYLLEAESPLDDIEESKLIQGLDFNENYKERFVYNYDSFGNPVYIVKDNTEEVIYVWDYEYHQYPIAEIKNINYSDIYQNNPSLAAAILDMAATRSDPDILPYPFNEVVRNILSKAQITTYTYKPLVGMTSKTDPRGVTTTYHYDDFNRLKYIKDHNGKIIERYDYHYQNQE